jgi:histidyl-tRNA synthetase
MAKKSSEKKVKKKVKKKDLILQPPRGMHDILPVDQPLWEKVRKAAKDASSFYQFMRIDTPIAERVEIFEKSIGIGTDIVEKEMFVFRSGSDKLALRPENTAGIVRSYIQHGLSHLSQPVKLYSDGPFFRKERPQSGRYRQFHQVEFDIIGGISDPIYDAQIILVCHRFLEGLKIKNVTVQINSIGCKQCRTNYIKKLKSYYKDKKRKICVDCKKRLTANPLRVLDCKNDSCQETKKGAPNILDSLCALCKKHFKEVLEFIEEASVPYMLNPHLVRGLDYYSQTVFEFTVEDYEVALGAGGRYDNLVALMGGADTPAVGAAMGVERVVEVIKNRSIRLTQKPKARVFLIHIGTTAKHKSLALIEDFRKANIDVIEALGKESLGAQLKAADKAKSPLALILGQKEVYEGTIIVRDMETGAQETMPLEKLVDAIKKRIK